MSHQCGSLEPVSSHHIKPEHWVQHWMNECPELLGGWNGDPHDNFRAFWHAFQIQHPGHAVFAQHHGRLHRVAPLILHGDEGRAVKRTNYLVVSMQSPLGSLNDPNLHCTCCAELSKRSRVPNYGTDLGAVDTELLEICRKQTTNYKGHSFLSHCLLFGLGGWTYKRHPTIVEDLLAEITKSLCKLFYDGVSAAGGTMYGALISIKGDMDWHKKVMSLDRSYANAGTSEQKELCHLCKAGGPTVPFEDYSENPGWLCTVGVERPWPSGSPPTLTQVPFDETCPEMVLQPDLFHIHKLGFARDVIGGVLILLLRLGFYDHPGSSVNIVDRFERAHSWFVLFCRAQGHSPGLRSFTKAFFNMQTLISAPWSSSKGSDSILLLQWLRHSLRIHMLNRTVPGHEQLLSHMLQVVEACLGLRMVHHHKLWLDRQCARLLYVHMMTALRGYSRLGKAALQLHIRAFIQKPKTHALHHLAIFLKQELEKGASVIMSPQAHACEVSEDFMGRVCRLSRRVGFRQVNLRVCHRYFIKVNALLRKRRASKNPKVWSKR